MKKLTSLLYNTLVLSIFMLPSTALLAGDRDRDNNSENLSQPNKGTSSQTGSLGNNTNQGNTSNPSGSQPSGSSSGSMGGSQEGGRDSSSGMQGSGSPDSGAGN